MLPVVDENPQAPSALPTPDSFTFFTAWGKKSNWKNEVTVKTQVQCSFHLSSYSPGPGPEADKRLRVAPYPSGRWSARSGNSHPNSNPQFFTPGALVLCFHPTSSGLLTPTSSIEAFRAYEPSAHIHRISPTPLLMTVAQNDCLTPATLALEAYSRALEPKELNILSGGHFDGYSGEYFDGNAGRQVEFLRKYLCK